jgi:hypothetical protein
MARKKLPFEPKPDHVGFVVVKVALRQNSLLLVHFSPVSIIPLLLHTYSLIYHRRCIILTFMASLNKKLSLFLLSEEYRAKEIAA